MYTSRICPNCKLNRYPEEQTVSEGKKKYVIYICRYCKHKDIDRIVPGTIKVWDENTGTFFDYDDLNPPKGTSH